MSPCAGTAADPQVFEDAILQAGDSLPFELDLYEFCAIVRQPNTEYADGDKVRPPVPNGFALECVDVGVTGEDMPAYLAKLNQEFRDGSARWKVIAASGNAINAASNATSTVTPGDSGGLAVEAAAIMNATLFTGTYVGGVRGEVYEALHEFEVDGVPRAARQTVRVV